MSEMPVRLSVSSRTDLLGMIPYTMGFHPERSIVAVGLEHGRVGWIFRADLDTPAEALSEPILAAALDTTASPQVVFVGYGPADVAETIRQLHHDLTAEGIAVVDLLRVDGGRFYCLSCLSCPEVAGMPFDPRETVFAAKATVAGLVALPDRDAVLAQVAPDLTAHEVIEAALARLAAAGHTPNLARDSVIIDQAMKAARGGARMDDDAVARLALLLQHLPLRDHAWQATDGYLWQRELWLDLTRRVPEPLVTPIACLAAWAAWRGGDSVLAGAALGRAYAVDPHYGLAELIGDLLASRRRPDRLVPVWPLLAETLANPAVADGSRKGN